TIYQSEFQSGKAGPQQRIFKVVAKYHINWPLL
ncbi:hypothetical protein scyTo_0022671, partial [Scyliorhinus torazame]|nr:hypothetical protein [Scyliorhinus torazame]